MCFQFRQSQSIKYHKSIIFAYDIFFIFSMQNQLFSLNKFYFYFFGYLSSKLFQFQEQVIWNFSSRERQKYIQKYIIMKHSREHDRHRHNSDSYERPRRRSRSSEDKRRSRHYDERYHDDRRHHDDHYFEKSRRSRSRSKERRPVEYYEERKTEEKEHKIRLAIRNNALNYDAQLLQLFMALPETRRDQLTEEAQSPQRIDELILVRELYVSGLYDASEESIRQFFSKYGEIEDVEIIKNFIFVKYFKVEDASNACTDYHNINTTLHQSHNPSFKIFYADNLKRFNVVSNNPTYEQPEILVPVLYASIKNDPQYTNEQYLHSIFNRYGFVRNLEVKRNDLPTQRTYVLVEYENMAMTFRARDKLRQQNDKLGDRKSEITILIDNEQATRLYPNISNQLRYQKKRTQASMSRGMEMNQTTFPIENPPQDYGFQPKDTDDIFNMIQQFAQKEEPQEEHMESDWCGFFTRNKQFKVEVDFFRIHKEPFELECILNVSHRGDVREALSRNDYVLAGRFKAANATSVDPFSEYIKYLVKKNRSGVIFTKDYLIQLFPPLSDLTLPYPIHDNELLALFFKI